MVDGVSRILDQQQFHVAFYAFETPESGPVREHEEASRIANGQDIHIYAFGAHASQGSITDWIEGKYRRTISR
jgi:hypothetical protein